MRSPISTQAKYTEFRQQAECRPSWRCDGLERTPGLPVVPSDASLYRVAARRDRPPA